MRLCGLAALVVVALAAQRGAAADYATELHFVRNGAPVRTVDLATLKANCRVQTVTIDDPCYQRRNPSSPAARRHLRLGFGQPADARSQELPLRARDGYAKLPAALILPSPGASSPLPTPIARTAMMPAGN
jgi:hypothetical protein